MASSKGGTRNVVNTSTTTAVDPASQRFIGGTLRPAGQQLAQLLANQPAVPGVDPATNAAISGLSSPLVQLGQTQLDPFTATRIGELGGVTGTIQDALRGGSGQFAGFLGGGGGGGAGLDLSEFDPARIRDFFNPFEEDVVRAQEGTFDRQRQLATQAARQAATRDNIFGGDRSALLEAEALGSVGRTEAESLANLRRQGFSDAMSTAVQEFLGRNQILGNLAAANAQAGATVGAASIGAQQRFASDQLNSLLRAREFDIGTELQRQIANQGAAERAFGLNLQNLGQGVDARLRAGQLDLGRLGSLGALGADRRNAAIQQSQLPLENFIRGLPAIAGSLGPTGSTTNQRGVERSGGSSLLGQLLGGALTIGGSLLGGPLGGAGGSALAGAIGSSQNELPGVGTTPFFRRGVPAPTLL